MTNVIKYNLFVKYKSQHKNDNKLNLNVATTKYERKSQHSQLKRQIEYVKFVKQIGDQKHGIQHQQVAGIWSAEFESIIIIIIIIIIINKSEKIPIPLNRNKRQRRQQTDDQERHQQQQTVDLVGGNLKV